LKWEKQGQERQRHRAMKSSVSASLVKGGVWEGGKRKEEEKKKGGEGGG